MQNTDELNEILTVVLHQLERIFVRACERWDELPDRCIECTLPAECNYRGLAAAYCERHAKFDMDRVRALAVGPVEEQEDFKKGYCRYMVSKGPEPAQCSNKASYGKLGFSPDRCRSHCEVGYINNPRKQCNHGYAPKQVGESEPARVKCRNLAVHGGSFGHGAMSCAEHFQGRRWETVDPTLPACSQCGYPTMRHARECYRCSEQTVARGHSDRNDEVLETLEKLEGWRVDTFRPIPTYHRPIAYVRNHNRVIVVEYMNRCIISEDLEELPRMNAAREALLSSYGPDLQMVYLFVSCGHYRYRGERHIIWKNALQETISMVQFLTGNPEVWHRFSYVKLFHNHYARGSTFQAAEQIVLF